MSTPHNRAEKGEFAKTVLMPGDPLRAKYVAENFMENARLVTDVRGMYGYTGTYKGKPISVMGSGMGMPSIGIYSYELYHDYDVENIVRIGSAGGHVPEAKLMSVVLATSAYSESSYARLLAGHEGNEIGSSEKLNEKLRASAAALGIPLLEGCIHSSDVFYETEFEGREKHLQARRDHKVLCVEMESFALFANAKRLGKQAACLLTISDSFLFPEIVSPEKRQMGMDEMITIALNAGY